MKELIDDWAGKGTQKAIISEQDAQAWRAAADTWRLFYWDWARKQNYPQETTPGGDTSWQDFGIPYIFLFKSCLCGIQRRNRGLTITRTRCGISTILRKDQMASLWRLELCLRRRNSIIYLMILKPRIQNSLGTLHCR